jgi:acyl carrier protein
MERSEVLQVLRDKAVERLAVEPDQVREEASLAVDLQVDSLSVVELVMDLEDHFGIELCEQQLATATTVGAVVDVTVAQLDARQ